MKFGDFRRNFGQAGCYRTLLECCLTYGARTIAIPCVATGIFGFPKHQACNIALGTVRDSD